MPDNNLRVEIVGDATKLHVELLKAQKDLQEFNRAAKQALAGGNEQAATQFARNAEVAALSYRNLSVRLRDTRKAADEARGNSTSGFIGLTTSVTATAKSFTTLGDSMNLVKGTIAAAGITEVARQLNDVNERLKGIQNTAKTTNFDPRFVATIQELLKSETGDAGAATSMLLKFSEAAQKARLEAQQAGQIPGGPQVFRGTADAIKGVTNEVTTLRGGMQSLGAVSTQVFHGDKADVLDLSNAFAAVKFSTQGYTSSLADQQRMMLDFNRRLLEFKNAGRIDEANTAALAMYGKTIREIAPILEKITDPAKLTEYQKFLQAKGLFPSDEDFARAKQYDDQLDGLSKTLAGLKTTAALSAFPYLSAQLKLFTQDIESAAKTIPKEMEAIYNAIFNPNIKEQLQELKDLWDGILGRPKEFTAPIPGAPGVPGPLSATMPPDTPVVTVPAEKEIERTVPTPLPPGTDILRGDRSPGAPGVDVLRGGRAGPAEVEILRGGGPREIPLGTGGPPVEMFIGDPGPQGIHEREIERQLGGSTPQYDARGNQIRFRLARVVPVKVTNPEDIKPDLSFLRNFGFVDPTKGTFFEKSLGIDSGSAGPGMPNIIRGNRGGGGMMIQQNTRTIGGGSLTTIPQQPDFFPRSDLRKMWNAYQDELESNINRAFSQESMGHWSPRPHPEDDWRKLLPPADQAPILPEEPLGPKPQQGVPYEDYGLPEPPQKFGDLSAPMQSLVAAINSVTANVQAAAESIQTAAEDLHKNTPVTLATGGMISGPGSGDTVPAMLTPGEFVNRVSSVQYYGAGLFRALNAGLIPREMFAGYALGGLVDGLHSPVGGFADGGLVASGGTPVHLHLGGHQFAMSAAPAVAKALVAEAGRYQMRSAGVKPSWYGGRPSG